MAFADCLNTIRQAAPSLTEQQAADLLDEVTGIVEQKRADESVADLNAAVRDAVQRRAEDAERAALIEKRNAAQRLQVRVRIRNKIDGMISQGKGGDVATYLESISAGIYGDSLYKESIEGTGNALQGQAYALFGSELRARNVSETEAIRFMRSRDASKYLIMESDNPGSSGLSIAKNVSEAMEATQEFLRQTANRYGADIGKIPGYLVKQAHDGDAMVREGKPAWMDFIRGLLDEEMTFGDMPETEINNLLSTAFDNIVLGGPSDIVTDLSASPGFKGPANVGKKLSSRRALHFKKDGQSTWIYLQRFGNTDLGSAFTYGVRGMSDAVGAMMHLGPNPEYMLREMVEYAKTNLRADIPSHRKVTDGEAQIIGLYEEVSGMAGIMPSGDTFKGKLARASNWTKNITGSALLGGASIASIADAGTAAARLTNIGIPFLQAHGDVLSALTRGRGDVETRKVAQSIGVGLEGLMSGVSAKWMGGDNGKGQGAHLVGTVMRITGMNWLNDAFKTSAGLSLSSYMATNADVAFDGLRPQLRREMGAYGIDATQWDSIRQAVGNMDERVYIDPSRISDEMAQRRFREFMVGFTNSAVLTPGARARRTTRLAGKRGEPMTEIALLFTHLKSFSITYFQEHLSRFYKSGEGVQLGYAIHLTLSALVYGYIAGTIKDIVAGREPRPLDNPATWADAWLTGGGAGFYGDVVFAMADQKKIPGKGLLEQTAGPGLGVLFTGANLIGNLATGDMTGAAVDANRIAKTVTPGSNIFYSRWVLDYLLWWPMAEYVRPGFAKRVEQRAKEDRGHEYLPNMGPVSAVENYR